MFADQVADAQALMGRFQAVRHGDPIAGVPVTDSGHRGARRPPARDAEFSAWAVWARME